MSRVTSSEVPQIPGHCIPFLKYLVYRNCEVFLEQDNFSALPLSFELLTVAQELGFEKLTPIQRESIPHLLEGKDLIGQAQTGSGKTAAFAIPILNQIRLDDKTLQALVLCPTRELAAQVVNEIRKWGRRYEGLQVLALTGGQSGREQAEAMDRGVQIAVGTPGRIVDLLERKRLDLESVSTIVFDEADKMLEMGFADELNFIMKHAPVQRQTILFSATFPDSIASLSSCYQKKPVLVKIEATSQARPAIEQYVYDSSEEEKMNILFRILQQHSADSTIVFFNMKSTINAIAEKMESLGVSYACLHGDLDQRERDRVMAMFRNGSYRILLATDVAARGLDIENLEMVVNYDFPQQTDVYIHRIGRTGRAGKAGVAITLADPRDAIKIMELEKATGAKFQRKSLGFKNQFGVGKELKTAVMTTLSISGGRKDKLRPGDILGALTGASGALSAKDIGKIEIQDKYSYVAVSTGKVDAALERLRTGRIKGQKFQIKVQK